MNRLGPLATATLSLTFSGIVWLCNPISAQTAPITDTFSFKGSNKGWCQDNPKFVEADRLNALDGVTVIITQDPLGTGDITTIQATIYTLGGSVEIDSMTLKGLVFPRNKSGRIAELLLSGSIEGTDHFLTVRGQATFDKTGHLIKVTGTGFDRLISTYTIDKQGTQSGPVECVDSFTFVMNQKPPSFGGGTLTVTGAPSDIGGTFVAAERSISQVVVRPVGLVSWGEAVSATLHEETVIVGFHAATNQIAIIIFMSVNPSGRVVWDCSVFESGCSGATVNRSAGTLTLSNTVLTDSVTANSPITLNGTLTITPF